MEFALPPHGFWKRSFRSLKGPSAPGSTLPWRPKVLLTQRRQPKAQSHSNFRAVTTSTP